MAEIENALKDIATDAGESFKEFFGRDYVSASGKVAAEFKGNIPVLQTEKWLALSNSEQEARGERAHQDRTAVGQGLERTGNGQSLSKAA